MSEQPIHLGRAGSLPRLRVRGRAQDQPVWARPALLGVLALAAVLCLWHLTIDGMSNEYYAAAAKSASVSWKAWFFGSLDPGSFITVDKPPLSLWIMGLSARILGFSSLSILLPQALETIAAVALLNAAHRAAVAASFSRAISGSKRGSLTTVTPWSVPALCTASVVPGSASRAGR